MCLLLFFFTVGIPTIKWCGAEGDYNVMVMELLGPSLEDLFNFCSRKFSLKTVLLLADQMVRLSYSCHIHWIILSTTNPELKMSAVLHATWISLRHTVWAVHLNFLFFIYFYFFEKKTFAIFCIQLDYEAGQQFFFNRPVQGWNGLQCNTCLFMSWKGSDCHFTDFNYKRDSLNPKGQIICKKNKKTFWPPCTMDYRTNVSGWCGPLHSILQHFGSPGKEMPWHITQSSQKSSAPNSPRLLCQPPPVIGWQILTDRSQQTGKGAGAEHLKL